MNQAERVKIIREHFRCTQKEFGAKIDAGQTYLSQIEKGDRPLTEKLIKLICYEFDVNYAWLKYGKGEIFSKAKEALVDQLADEYKLSNEKKELLERILALPDEEIDIFTRNVFGFDFIKKESDETNRG